MCRLIQMTFEPFIVYGSSIETGQQHPSWLDDLEAARDEPTVAFLGVEIPASGATVSRRRVDDNEIVPCPTSGGPIEKWHDIALEKSAAIYGGFVQGVVVAGELEG